MNQSKHADKENRVVVTRGKGNQGWQNVKNIIWMVVDTN